MFGINQWAYSYFLWKIHFFILFLLQQTQNHTVASLIDFGIDSDCLIPEHNNVSLVADHNPSPSHSIPLNSSTHTPDTSHNSPSLSESYSHPNTSPQIFSTSDSPDFHSYIHFYCS